MTNIKEIKIENILLNKIEEDSNDWWNENFPWSNYILLLRKKTLFAYILIAILFPVCFPLEIIYRTPRYVFERLVGYNTDNKQLDKVVEAKQSNKVHDIKI